MNKGKTAKRIGITLLIIMIILLVICAIAFGVIYSKVSKVNIIELNNIEINEGVEETLEGYRNIAIFGVDARADTYSKTRSDCIIIASVNEKTKDVKLTSVYRDTLVYIEGKGYDKGDFSLDKTSVKLNINEI